MIVLSLTTMPAKRTIKKRPKRIPSCPECASTSVIPVVHGVATPAIQKLVEAGKAIARRPRRMGRHERMVLQRLRLRLEPPLAPVQETRRGQRDAIRSLTHSSFLNLATTKRQRYRFRSDTKVPVERINSQLSAPISRVFFHVVLRFVISPRIHPLAVHRGDPREETSDR